MHTMIHCNRSSGPSSKGSRNAAPAQTASVAFRNTSGKSHHTNKNNSATRPRSCNTEPSGLPVASPPSDPNNHLDASDSDDCESVGSNPTPPPEPDASPGLDNHNPSPPTPDPGNDVATGKPSSPDCTPRKAHRRPASSNSRNKAPPHQNSTSRPPSTRGGARNPISRSPMTTSSPAPSTVSDFPQDQAVDSFDEGDGGGPPPVARFPHQLYVQNGQRQSPRRQPYGQRQSPRQQPYGHHGQRQSPRQQPYGHQPGQRQSPRQQQPGQRQCPPRQQYQRQISAGSSRGSSSGRGSVWSEGGWSSDAGSGLSAVSVNTPYPAKWRCFGRRPPAILEFRPLGEGRLKNVRPAGKESYTGRTDDGQLRGPKYTWDTPYGLAKHVTDCWTTPTPYGTKLTRVGDIDPYFHPSRGDLIVINPAQNCYRAMTSGYVMTYQGRDYSFGIGDLIVRLGSFLPSRKYIPYGNLELYMYTATRETRLLGRQPILLVDFNYHNLDYESPGKHLDVGTFLNEIFFPRRGDIIIRGGAWAENYPNIQRKHHSLVKYWRPAMEFLPNDMLLRPYVDIGRCRKTHGFYWGAVELYTYSGKGLAWAYWGRDHHIFDTPFPHEQEHGIKTGHHKDEVGHHGDGPPTHADGHGHYANDNCHNEHEDSKHGVVI